jgi:diguanylate cyclase (GGDEF)-like protein/PAS domain S-box-containing protein
MAARDARSSGARPATAPTPLARLLTPAAPYDPHAASREMAQRKALQKNASASHWHVTPASFLILGFVGVGLSVANTGSWLWIAALALNVVARLFIPAPRTPGRGEFTDPAVRWRAVSYLIDAALWAALVISIEPMPGAMATRVGGSLAVAILISSLSSASRSTPLGLALGWTIPVVALALHASSGGVIALGLILWIASVVWLGATRPVPVPLPRTTRAAPATDAAASSARRGVQLAIQAAGTPMIAVYNGRVFEINAAAAAMLGQLTVDCVGRRVTELVSFEPANALDLAQVSRNGPVAATIRSSVRAGEPPISVRIKAAQASGADRISVLALEPPDFAATALRPARVAPGAAPAPAQSSAPVVVPTLPEEPEEPELPLSAAGIVVAEGGDLPAVQRQAAEPSVDPLAALSAAGMLPQPDAQRLPALMLSKLPVLAWVVDGEGRVIHAHTDETRRWGMRIGPGQRPRWWDTFVYQARSRENFLAALKSALLGRPTYDLLVERSSPSGGRLALRTHIVPVQWPDAQGQDKPSALVLDTIASARELMDNERLRRRKDHYKSLVEASPNLIWACDSNFRFTFVSRRACRDLYGYAVDDLVGVSMGVLLDPSADQGAARRALVGLRDGRVMRDVEMAHVTKDGRHIIVAVSAAALSGSNRGFAGAVGMMVDLTALKQREASLAEALRVERTVLDSSGQALAVIRDGAIARCNDALLQLLQCSAADLQGIRVVDIFSERSEWTGAMAAADRAALNDQAVVREIKLRRPGTGPLDDQTVWCQLTLRSIDQGEYVLALADIDSIRRREAHALFDARHDELTGLANRRLFSERARAALATSALRNSGCAIVVIDLDRFKQVNDRFGHQAGDEVLQEMARRLQRVVRPQDTVARYGGDEFALLIPDAGSRRDIEAIAGRIIEELARPVSIGGCIEEELSASVGIALAWEQGREPSWLLSLADRAMYEAKTAGGNRAIFAPTLDPIADGLVGAPAAVAPAVDRAA